MFVCQEAHRSELSASRSGGEESGRERGAQKSASAPQRGERLHQAGEPNAQGSFTRQREGKVKNMDCRLICFYFTIRESWRRLMRN